MSVRHSILVITYRQESLIGGCLDSILSQSERPYEVVVCDDCSPDGTWEVVQQYAAQYPDIIKPIRQEQNVGLFRNLHHLINQASGDLINIVAGDDLLPEGILEQYSRFIEQHGLNCADSFVIYTNAMVLKPDGERVVKSNKANYRENMFEVGVEQCFWSWDTGLSKGLMDRVKGDGVCMDFGYQGDLIWNLTKIDRCDKSYFMDEVGYIYRANMGVSVATQHIEHYRSKQRVVEEIFRRFPARISDRVRKFYRFDEAWMRYNAYPNFRNYCRYLKEYVAYGRFPKGNIHRNPLKVLPPIWAKNLIKKLLGRSY